VLTCVNTKGDVSAWFQPLRGGQTREVRFLAKAYVLPLRWQVDHGALWMNDSWKPDLHLSEVEKCFELQELFKGQRVIGPGANPKKQPLRRYFPTATSAKMDAQFLGSLSAFDVVVCCATLPVARDTLMVFVLTNVGGRGTPMGGSDRVALRRYPRKVGQTWSLTCTSVRNRWDVEKVMWEQGREREECNIEVGFHGHFQALARGEDYYFLTNSCKLFRAPKPTKGTRRKLETIWDDWRAPIKAFICDSDRGRTFLFCDKGPKGIGGPCVFELASAARPRFYDGALYKPGDQGPDRLRRVVGYVRVLEALGFVKSDTGKR
jgi:hypothetical protein